MKTKNNKFYIYICFIFFMGLMSCSDEVSERIYLIIQGTDISEGEAGDKVVITGTGFSPSPTGNLVTFNGVISVVTASTSTSITTSVPKFASTGNITVTVNNEEAPGPVFNIILPPPTLLGYSSFEEVTTFIGDIKYRKVATDVNLTNTQESDPGSEDPYVDFVATGNELGFDSTYEDIADTGATSERIGVFSNANLDTAPADFEARFEDGTQGFVASDQDKTIKITFDEITTLTSSAIDPKIEVKFFIASTTFEEGEGIQVFYETTAGLGAPLIEYLNDDAEAIAGSWQTISAILSTDQKTNGKIVIKLISSQDAEMVFVDSVRLTAIIL